jgi:hypothetical protein
MEQIRAVSDQAMTNICLRSREAPPTCRDSVAGGNMRPFIVIGDRTSHGGAVVEGTTVADNGSLEVTAGDKLILHPQGRWVKQRGQPTNKNALSGALEPPCDIPPLSEEHPRTSPCPRQRHPRPTGRKQPPGHRQSPSARQPRPRRAARLARSDSPQTYGLSYPADE